MFNTYDDHVKNDTKARNRMNGEEKMYTLIVLFAVLAVISVVAGLVVGGYISATKSNEYMQICIINGGHLTASDRYPIVCTK